MTRVWGGLVALVMLAVAGCGDDGGGDGGLVDSSTADGGNGDAAVDASGDDAGALDAAGDDAASVDAAGVDAPGVDAPGSDAGPGRFGLAVIGPDCAPDDGPALRLTLATGGSGCTPDTSGETLVFYLFGDFFPVMAPETLTLSTGLGGDGNATYCPGGPPPCETSMSGTLTFDTFTDGVEAKGSYSITFGSGRTEEGTFEATWCDPPEPLLCG